MGDAAHLEAPARPNTLDLLPTFRGTSLSFPSAASWVLSSNIRLQAGFASSRRLMLMGLYPRRAAGAG